MIKQKWRGIVTTQQPKNENQPKTIINRLGQKSISLPRIDDKKRWAGYAGIAGIAKTTSKLVSNCLYYVEPFAGTAKVYQETIKRKDVCIKHAILNDTSEFIYRWLKQEFSNEAFITKNDFVDCIQKWDSYDTFFLIDPPWFRGSYDQPISSFNRKSVVQYDQEVLELCKKIKGKFIITTRKENKTMLNSEFNHKFVKSNYVVCGHYPKVLLTTNLFF